MPSHAIRFVRSLLGWLAFALPAAAFPPAPYYTVFGLVRDQTGSTLLADGANLLLLRNGAEIGRTPIFSEIRFDYTYELDIRIDTGRASTRFYTDRAVPALGLFSLAVALNGELFYPIEVAGDLRAGAGGERIRLDLTLGEDLDRDGLPDAWEYWQLYQRGEYPGAAGWDLARVTKAGDLDGDGVSNFQEYVAGTFAGDATERFELVIKSYAQERIAFEFFAITNKVYTIEQSSDLVSWTEALFSTVPDGPSTRSLRATAIGVRPLYVRPDAGNRKFYRLTVR